MSIEGYEVGIRRLRRRYLVWAPCALSSVIFFLLTHIYLKEVVWLSFLTVPGLGFVVFYGLFKLRCPRCDRVLLQRGYFLDPFRRKELASKRIRTSPFLSVASFVPWLPRACPECDLVLRDDHQH